MTKWTPLIKVAISPSFNESVMNDFSSESDDFTSACGSTTLHFSIIGGNTQTVQYLLGRGCNPNKANNNWETPLHWACKAGNLQIVQLLLSHGAKCDVVDVDDNTPLHWAVEYDHVDIAKELIQGGVSTTCVNDAKYTPMEIAILNRSTKCIELLQSPGPSPTGTKNILSPFFTL